jgi:hypothetical protein
MVRVALLLAGAPAAAPLSAGDGWLAAYGGLPFVPKSPQLVPGPLKFAYFDTGGEGVAYHNPDGVNRGSGKFNPADGNALNEFRMKETVSISFTKGHDIDENPFNRCRPQVGSLYVGWSKPGEWLNYTVLVEKAGSYFVSLLYTENGSGRLGLTLDGDLPLAEVAVPGTDDPKEPIKWRQWHHWAWLQNAATIVLPAGRHVLTVRILERGDMNLDTLDVRAADGAASSPAR